MQFESPNFHFDVDDTFSLCSQPMSCPSTATSFSSSSSASVYGPFTPTSRRSTPHELATMEFDGSFHSHAQRVELTPPSTLGSNSSSKYVLAGTPVVKTEPDQQHNQQQVGFPNSLPGTPMKREPVTFDYMEAVLHHSSPMGSLTPSNSFGMYAISPDGSAAAMGGHTPFIMTPTHSLSGSGSEAPDTASSSWSCTNDSPISFFPHKENMPSNYEVLEIERNSLSPYRMPHHHHNNHDGDANSPNRMRAQRKMLVHEAQRKSHELQRVAEFPPRAPVRSNGVSNGVSNNGSNNAGRKRGPKTPNSNSSLNVVQRSPCRCDYTGCTKVFRRNEHLKRHKQTFHGEGPNRFSCEFCGKDQFNRQDNLNNHRKLHARPNNRNRGVEYIAAAVPVIEEEERCRKRRAPPKSRLHLQQKLQQQQQQQLKREEDEEKRGATY